MHFFNIPKFIGFNQAFLFMDMEDFLQRATIENLQKPVNRRANFPLFSFLTIMALKMYSCILSFLENVIPMNKSLVPVRRLAHPPKRKARAREYSSAVKVEILGKLFVI